MHDVEVEGARVRAECCANVANPGRFPLSGFATSTIANAVNCAISVRIASPPHRAYFPSQTSFPLLRPLGPLGSGKLPFQIASSAHTRPGSTNALIMQASHGADALWGHGTGNLL